MKVSSNNLQLILVLIAILLSSKFRVCWSVSDNKYERQTLLDINNAFSHPCPCINIPADLDPAAVNTTNPRLSTTSKLRKRGRRGGVRNRIRRRKYKPFVPSVIFGNCRSIHNKIDELRANCRFLHQYREACCIALTETWLHNNIPTSAVEVPNFTTIRSDRTGDQSKTKGGGVMLNINNNWCNNITITSSICDSNIEALTVNLRPFYIPREFTNIFITVLYIPPSANKATAFEYVDNLCNKLANDKPDSLQIILGDMNRCKLKLPNFTQYVSCSTRNNTCLDEFFCNATNAYRSIQEPPLKNSDHNMIYMQPVYCRDLRKAKPTEKEIAKLTDESLETLNTSFEITEWNMFVDCSNNIDELVNTVTEYIKFNIDMIVPKKTIQQYPNNKPWITPALRKLIVEKHRAFSRKADNYKHLQEEVDKAIKDAKIEYKNHIEQKFKTNRMKDAWSGLKILTGQKDEKKANSLTSTPGSADRLNVFYSRFDNIDYSDEHSTLRKELGNKMKK